MSLPGGILRGDVRITQYAFKPMCGAFELTCSEFAQDFELLPPRQVTDLLTKALCHLGHQPVTWQDVHNMTMVDRQFLLRRLVIALGHDSRWMTSVCDGCKNRFDFNVVLSELPIRQGSETYPYTDLVINGQHYRFRMPSGADQELLTRRASASERDVLSLLYMQGKSKEKGCHLPQWTAEQQGLIEDKIENTAPDITSKIQVSCPDCKNILIVNVCPERIILQVGRGIYSEIHQLASFYHWAEKDILEMPSMRRKNYLALIERSKGHTPQNQYATQIKRGVE